jgi:hypothetical protein
MGKYLQGIIGAFSGKIGPVIGSSRNGVPYMKGRGNPRTGPVPEKEAENRNKFSTGHAWLKPLLVVLRVGFHNYSRITYGYNAAKSYNFKHAMENGAMIPARVKVSFGDLPLPENLTATLESFDTFRFDWSTEYTEPASRKDQIMVLVYHPESKTAIYEIHGSFRQSGSQTFNVSSGFKGKTVHVYAAFIAADRTRQSDSIYLGEFMP